MSPEADSAVRYRRDGFALFGQVYDLPSVAAALDHLHSLVLRRPHPSPIVAPALEIDPFMATVANDDRLTSIARLLLGSTPIPFGCSYIVKDARSGLPVWWHQDGHPWTELLEGASAVTLWMALDRTDEDNGCLEVIPGSHVLPAQPLRPNCTEPSVFGLQIDLDLVDRHAARPLRMEPGDVSAHHPNLIHGSAPNRSDRLRRALAVRYRVAAG